MKRRAKEKAFPAYRIINGTNYIRIKIKFIR